MPLSAQATLDQVVAAHARGDLARAEILCRQAIAAEPGNFQAWYMLGALAFQQRRGEDALAALDKALGAQSQNLRRDRSISKARRCARWSAKAKRWKDFSAAVIKLQPDNPDLWLNRSSVLGDLGRTEDALADVDKALKLRPTAPAWNNRGAALRALKRHNEALKSFEKALALQPGYIQAMRNIAAVKCESFRVGEGLADYARQAKLAYGGGAAREENWELPQKQRHDAEQKAWLAGEGIDALFYLDAGARVPGSAVNPLNAGPIAEQWVKNRPQIVVIDNLLTPEALEGLRRFASRLHRLA